jgi:hypothetical protein
MTALLREPLRCAKTQPLRPNGAVIADGCVDCPRPVRLQPLSQLVAAIFVEGGIGLIARPPRILDHLRRQRLRST